MAAQIPGGEKNEKNEHDMHNIGQQETFLNRQSSHSVIFRSIVLFQSQTEFLTSIFRMNPSFREG